MKLLLRTILLVIIMLTAFGCSSDKSTTPDSPDLTHDASLVGTWQEVSLVCGGVEQNVSSTTITANADGTGYTTIDGENLPFTWSTSGGSVTVTSADASGFTATYIVSGNTFTMTTPANGPNEPSCVTVMEKVSGPVEHDPALVGSWNKTSEVCDGVTQSFNPTTVTFNADGTGSVLSDGVTESLVWHTSGNILTATEDGETFSASYSIVGSVVTMTFVEGGTTCVETFQKQGPIAHDPDLVGTWTETSMVCDGEPQSYGSVVVTFNANGTGLVLSAGETETLAWHTSGNSLTVTITDRAPFTATYAVTGNTVVMTFIDGGETCIETFTKGTPSGNHDPALLGSWSEQFSFCGVDTTYMAVTVTFTSEGSGYVFQDGETVPFTWQTSGSTLTLVRLGENYLMNYLVTGNILTLTISGGGYSCTEVLQKIPDAVIGTTPSRFHTSGD